MKFRNYLAALPFLLPAIVFAQEAVQKSVSVTAFNDDFGVVREKREVDLKKGVSFIRLSDIPEKINPRTVKVKLDGQVLEQNYQYDLANFSKILAKYIDKDVTFLSPDKNYTGKLVSVSGRQITLKDSAGGLIMIPDLNKFTLTVSSLPEGFVSKPTLVWKVNSNIAGKALIDISYQTQGISWNADYVAVLNENDTEMDVNAWVSLDNNSGATYKNANLKLMAGDVERVVEVDTEHEFASIDKLDRASAVNNDDIDALEAAPKFEEKAFFEYHKYDLDKIISLQNNEQKQLALFDSKNVKVSKNYKTMISNRILGNSIKNSEGFETYPVDVSIEFKNTKENNLGMPLPAGIFRVNKTEDGDEEFVGEQSIEHTPQGEKVEVYVGKAFDVLVKAKLIKETVISKHKSDFEILFEIVNSKENVDITPEIEIDFKGFFCEVIECDIPYTKTTANIISFKKETRKNSKASFTAKFRIGND